MDILDIQILGGPNYWSVHHKIIAVKLDIGKYEELPTNRIRGFASRLQKLLPGLKEHHCSPGKPGGFISRMKKGTWLGHVVEHVALEIQTMAGMNCSFGKTTSTDKKGVYSVAFSYEEERAGLYAAHIAARIIEAVAEGLKYDIDKDIRNLRKIAAEDSPGPSTSAIIKAAASRNIPHIRLDGGSLVQLGYGAMQRRIEATITDDTSTIAVDLASDKQRTRSLLLKASIPVPEGLVITDISELDDMLEHTGFPVVIKPDNGNQGKGVTLNITNYTDAVSAFKKAASFSTRIIIEKYHPGNDYRLLLINYKLVAAALRTPAMVTGDGFSPIRELVEKANADPSRGEDHESILTKIKLDKSAEDYLRYQNLTFDSVPGQGQKIFLKGTANLSTGGTSEDVTDIVHPEIVSMAVRAARVIGLNICGIDFVAGDISQPLKKSRGVIIEINAAPGFRMHTHPFKGRPRAAGEAVVDMLFPPLSNGRIPVIAVTGTKCKTTTTRLIAHIARTAGYTVGYTTTEGIYINGEIIEEGDCTGPVSAEKVLRDNSVNFAVLECARGGMLRSGLAFDKCDTGIVTNVAEDHIGLRNINSLEDMAMVKSIVPESVKPDGIAILNGNDDMVYAMKDRVRSRYALFSIDPGKDRVREHIQAGGVAAIFMDGQIQLVAGRNVIFSENIENIPVSFGGKAPFMIENILAAVLAAWSQDIDKLVIIKALRSFIPSFENSPGRMNLFKFSNFSFLLDYAHNFHGISALGSFIKKFEATLKIGIVSAVGDRRDIDIFNVGKASAHIFNEIIIRIDDDTRGRKDTEIAELIYSGIRSVKKETPVKVIREEREAVEFAISNVKEDSLIVLFSDKIMEAITVINEFREKEKAGIAEEVLQK